MTLQCYGYVDMYCKHLQNFLFRHRIIWLNHRQTSLVYEYILLFSNAEHTLVPDTLYTNRIGIIMLVFTLYRLYERLEEEKGISFQEFKENIRYDNFITQIYFISTTKKSAKIKFNRCFNSYKHSFLSR